jgi:hypothetical protein
MPVNGPINENQIAFKAVMPWHEGHRVKNVFAGTLAVGTLVAVNGTTTDPARGDDVFSTVTKADADGAAPVNEAMYVVTEAMAQDTYGSVGVYFVQRGVDTSTWTLVGDPVYLSATAGGITPTAPGVGAVVQRVGYVAVKSSTAGVVVYDLRSNAVSVPNPLLDQMTVTALADADATLSAAQHQGQIVTVAAGANNRTITTLTAALLLAAYPGARVGSTALLRMCNLKAANTVTVGLGSGVTGATGFNAVVAAQTACTFALTFTNVTAASEAVTITRVGG